MLLKQAHLKRPGESLQVTYPPNYRGQRSFPIEADEFFVGSEPLFLTNGEIELVQALTTKLPYRQEIILTGAVLVDSNDPLLLMTDDELDEVESVLGLESSRDPSGAELSTRERVYRTREAEPDRQVDTILRKALPVPEVKPQPPNNQVQEPPPEPEPQPEPEDEIADA